MSGISSGTRAADARDAVQARVLGARLVLPTDGDGDYRVESPSGLLLGRGRSMSAAWIAAERNAKGGAG